MFHRQLTWACDLIILNACCLTALQAWLAGISWLWGISLLNAVAVIALRQWLMKSLQIAWTVSLLNQGLRRLTDILVSFLFLITIFPVIIVIQTVIIKGSKRHKGALFSAVAVRTDEDRHFTALVFSNIPQQGSNLICLTPLVLHLLTGTISLNHLSSLSVRRMESRTAEERGNPLEPLHENLSDKDIIYDKYI